MPILVVPSLNDRDIFWVLTSVDKYAVVFFVFVSVCGVLHGFSGYRRNPLDSNELSTHTFHLQQLKWVSMCIIWIRTQIESIAWISKPYILKTLHTLNDISYCVLKWIANTVNKGILDWSLCCCSRPTMYLIYWFEHQKSYQGHESKTIYDGISVGYENIFLIYEV